MTQNTHESQPARFVTTPSGLSLNCIFMSVTARKHKVVPRSVNTVGSSLSYRLFSLVFEDLEEEFL